MSEPRAETYGELGPAMKALNERHREFVRHLVTGPVGHGRLTRAYKLAGYKSAKASTLSKEAHALSRDERVIAAIAEELKKVLRIGHPEIVAAAFNLVRSPEHRDHGRAVFGLLDRLDPVQTKHSIDVTHRTIDPDQEALEEMRAARKLGATRAKLLELYGANGLDRLEALEAVDNARRADAAKIIEHQPEAGHDR